MKILLLVMTLVTTQSFAMAGKGESQKRAEEFRKELNLTDEQVKKFGELKKSRGDHKEMKAKYKEARKAFKSAIKDPKATNEELTAKFEAFMKLRDEYQKKRFARMLEKRAILTPEQFQKFMSTKDKWREGKKGRKGKTKGW